MRWQWVTKGKNKCQPSSRDQLTLGTNFCGWTWVISMPYWNKKKLKKKLTNIMVDASINNEWKVTVLSKKNYKMRYNHASLEHHLRGYIWKKKNIMSLILNYHRWVQGREDTDYSSITENWGCQKRCYSEDLAKCTYT